MTNRLTLSKAEVAELTRSRRRLRQIDFLRRNGIRHYVDDYGWPVVLWATVAQTGEPAQDGQPAWKPNKVA